ncbi:MAG: hypothetical protein ACR2JN_01000 [Lapillicoccus sp.]
MARRLVTVTASVVIVVSLLVAAHVVLAFRGPGTDSRRVGAQVAWLDTQLRDGAARRMQAFFPEGELFTNLLTGIAAAQLATTGSGDTRAGQLTTARYALTEVDQPRNRDLFGDIPVPPNGVFYRGWPLLLLVDIAAASGSAGDVAAVDAEARTLRQAFDASPTGLLESYPGQYWPCDNVVGIAALVRADALLGTPGASGRPTGRALLGRLDPLRDRATGLLPHRTDAAGRPLDGPRGSSQSLIQVFLPDIDDAQAHREWTAYKSAFVVRELGLVGVREYPVGVSGPADADSGPLLLGVSASASAVTLGAARRNGDTRLAASLDHEAEMLGVGLQWGGKRRYALGALPVGDAFLAWARSRPASSERALDPGPTPLWPVYLLLALLPGAVAAALLAMRGRAATHQQGSPTTPTRR